MEAAQTISIEKHNEHVQRLEGEIKLLNEQLGWLKRQVFGKRSEKVAPTSEEQLVFDGFGEIENPVEEKQEVPDHKRSKGKKKASDKVAVPKDIPIEKKVIDLPEEEKVCPKTGKPLVKIGEEVTSKLAHRPGSFFIKQTIRLKYALPQGEGVSCAELPDSLLDRCFADESFLAEILVNKFSDHLPLYRSEEILKRHEIQISRQTLSQWVLRSTEALTPLYEELRKEILGSGSIFVDESPVSMLAPGKGKVHKAYMWVVASGGLSFFKFYEDRKHLNAKDLLKKYSGVFHSDKYGAYEQLALKEGLIWCPCWAHIRRKFFEAESGDPKFRNWMLRHIKYLFMLERVAWARPPDERLKIRQEKQIPIIDKMIEACKRRMVEGKLLPKSNLRKALGYFCSLIPYLKNYVFHADAHLDNNTAERVIRPLAIGRKNWMFVGNSRGGKAAAVAISLIQSCRNLGINPREYLEDVMRRLMSHPASKLQNLLPHHWKKATT